LRLEDQARKLERYASGPSLDALMAEERRRSHACGGRTVFGAAKPEDAAAGGHETATG
jgi:hypothetical protein